MVDGAAVRVPELVPRQVRVGDELACVQDLLLEGNGSHSASQDACRLAAVLVSARRLTSDAADARVIPSLNDTFVSEVLHLSVRPRAALDVKAAVMSG